MKSIALEWPNEWPDPTDGLRLQVKVKPAGGAWTTVVNDSGLPVDQVNYDTDWVADADYEIKIFARFEAEEYPTPKTVTFHTPPNLTANGSGGLTANETSV